MFNVYLGDRDRFSLPEDVTILHAEFTYYYYPGDITFPCKQIFFTKVYFPFFLTT